MEEAGRLGGTSEREGSLRPLGSLLSSLFESQVSSCATQTGEMCCEPACCSEAIPPLAMFQW